MDKRNNPRRDGRRFLVAVALFLVWVTTLGVMAVKTGHRPTTRPATPGGR